MTKTRLRVYRIAAMGIFAALSIVLVYFIHFPIFPAVPFLEYDPADVPIIICAYLFGPLHGLVLTVVVSVVQGLTVSAQSGWIGILMHILATGALVLAGSGLRLLLHTRKQKTGAGLNAGVIDIISAFSGTVAMTVTMALWNMLFTPIFMGVTLDVVMPLMPFIVAFNLIKAALNSAVALVIYKLLPKRLLERLS
ncbi:MAG TPA: ECF transporter S component [Bacillota bacterium]|nr:ECF transporter S component [Clostridiales bacterium]HPT85419.1 ECF transporter S component [Bacillota bacterium]